MKFRNLKNWDAPQDSIGLVYFWQLIEEMLFDFSLDTYKASVMHTGLLCIEAVEVIKEIENGNVKPPNIFHVNEELCSSFEKDPVAQALIPLPPSAFFPTLKNPKSSLKEMETVLTFLSFQLSDQKYRVKNQDLLRAEIIGRKSVAEIRRLTRSFITELVASGFDQRYIRDCAFKFFYSPTNRIANSEAIDDFFVLFPFDAKNFNVIFRVDPIFEHLADALSPLKLVITKTLPNTIELSNYSKFASCTESTIFAIAEKVSANDIFSARNVAEYRLKLCATLLNFFHHKENPAWRPDCIVYNVSDNICTQISSPINSMHKCADLKQIAASTKLKSLLNEFSLENNSFVKFVRSVQLHSMALTSNSYENQILNLWIALESLIPSETKDDGVSNIEHIVESLVPFLNIGYIERLIFNLVKDLFRWDSIRIKKSLRNINGKKLSERLVKLMILEEHAMQRAILVDGFRNFHLMHDRFESISLLISNPLNVIKALNAHKVRIAWQIRRIYRTRNIIVHSGKTPSCTKALIEHSHDYLDTVLSILIKLASTPKSVNSVAQGFKYIEIKYGNFYKDLMIKNLSFNSDNIETLLLQK